MNRIFRFFLVLFLAGICHAEISHYQTISWDAAIEKRHRGDVFLDVRTPEEVAGGTVEGAINIPLGELATRAAELPKDKAIFVFCRSGVRSRKASEFLDGKEFTVYNIDGGFLKAPPKSAFK